MKKLITTIVGALFAVFILAVSPVNSLAAEVKEIDVPEITEFESMFTVRGVFLGAMSAIRGVPGAGLPWTLGSVNGELRINGDLSIDVMGLVLANDPMVPENLRLTNPVAYFRAIVSCKSTDALGKVTTVNTMTDLFPATMTGDAEIDALLYLPDPCVAPVIFVTSPEGAWFAVTGR
jgi:hypothetical protein